MCANRWVFKPLRRQVIIIVVRGTVSDSKRVLCSLLYGEGRPEPEGLIFRVRSGAGFEPGWPCDDVLVPLLLTMGNSLEIRNRPVARARDDDGSDSVAFPRRSVYEGGVSNHQAAPEQCSAFSAPTGT